MGYDLVLALHVLSVVVAFGALFVTPLVLRHVRRSDPGGLAPLHRAQRRVGQVVTVPAATLALLTGAYMATARGYWEELWVSLPLSLLIFLLTAQGAFLAPAERRLEALAEAFASGGGREREAEYAAVARRYAVVVYAMCAAVVVAVAVMVTKVGG